VSKNATIDLLLCALLSASSNALLWAGPAAAQDALPLLARGVQALARGDLDQADRTLREARKADEWSALAAREHAIVLSRMGKNAEAREAIERAIALGDRDPEVSEIHARILGDLGEIEEAMRAAARAHTWEGDLIGASLGDRLAAHRASVWAEESSSRGALAALILAAHAGSTGERTTARTLVDMSEVLARGAGADPVLGAARALRDRLGLGGGERVRFAGRVRTSVDYATNPLFEADGTPGARPRGLRAAFAAEGGIQAPISTARLDAAARIEQRVQIIDRERFDGVDLSALSLAASVEVPISARPSAAQVGMTLRFHDLWGDAFDTHWATSFEAGPTLALPFDGSTKLVLGVFGVGVDFVDGSPRDAEISSQNRDRIGQRATAALLHDHGWFQLRGEVGFSRDDAFGEAFDSRGGVVAGRVTAEVTESVSIRTGVAVWLRSFGPVGDAVVLGAASTRLEVRTVAELAAEIRLSDHLSLLVEDDWIRNSGRAGHNYTHNVLSFGLEARW